MLKLIVFIFIIVFIFPSDCQNLSINIEKPLLCINNTYKIPLFTTRNLRMTFNRTLFKQMDIHTIRIQISITDSKVAEFQDHSHAIEKIFYLMNDTEQYNNKSIINYNFTIHTNYINHTYIYYFIETMNTKNDIARINCSIPVIISEPKRLRDKIFHNAIPYVIMFTSVQMGVLLDLQILKELARRPIQVMIGFICQYGLMPLIAFAISKIFQYQPLYGLGLFVVGCSPGGQASNQWTVVFDGDLNLSAFMSFASTAASFFMMPLWLYTLGQYAYLRELKLYIPFGNLAISLLTVVGPLALGMLFVYFIPKLKPIIKRTLKPMLIILLIYFYVFGAWVNYYKFHYTDLRILLTAPLLPWLGFVLGGLLAWICRQDYKRIITISLETGIQNIGVSLMILLYSFPSPINIHATVIPILISYVSMLIFVPFLIYQFIRRKSPKSEQPVKNISADTLSKTTNNLSEEEPLDNSSETSKIQIPVSSIIDRTSDSKPIEIE